MVTCLPDGAVIELTVLGRAQPLKAKVYKGKAELFDVGEVKSLPAGHASVAVE